jgi:hypothetical protein
MSISPSADELASLAVMTEILSSNPKASELARSLWGFFGFRVRCTLCDDDAEPSTHRVEGVHGPSEISSIGIHITVRRTDRAAEALVHELLHAQLIASGYPTFWIDEEQGSEKWNIAAGITNNADHVVIRPTYLYLGYDPARFLGPSKPLRYEHLRIIARLETAASLLSSPEGYLDVVSAELREQNITFFPLYLAQYIVPTA